MERISLASLLKLILSALIVCAVAGASFSAPSTPLDVQMSLQSGTVTLGEPILLSYRIINPNPEEGSARLGKDRKGWLTLSLVSSTGKTVPTVADTAASNEGGFGPTENAVISPGSQYTGFLILNQNFRIESPGTYRLSVNIKLPYVIGAESSSLTKDYTFGFVVTPRDSSRLRTAAESLRHQIIQDSNTVRRTAAIEALFSLPEEYALPIWRALVNDPNLGRFDRRRAANQLARISSASAVDLLAEMRWNPRQPRTQGGEIDALFQAMHRNGDSTLKQHIERQYTERGKRMPTRPIVMID